MTVLLPVKVVARTEGGKTPELIFRYLIVASDASIPELAHILDESVSAIEHALGNCELVASCVESAR